MVTAAAWAGSDFFGAFDLPSCWYTPSAVTDAAFPVRVAVCRHSRSSDTLLNVMAAHQNRRQPWQFGQRGQRLEPRNGLWRWRVQVLYALCPEQPSALLATSADHQRLVRMCAGRCVGVGRARTATWV